MKTSSFLSLSAAAGVALAYVSNASWTANFHAEYAVAAFAAAGVVALFVRDYSRRPRALAAAATLVHLPVPAATLTERTPVRSTAYGIRPRRAAIVERAA